MNQQDFGQIRSPFAPQEINIQARKMTFGSAPESLLEKVTRVIEHYLNTK